MAEGRFEPERRVEDVMRIPLGRVTMDMDGHAWIFLGMAVNTAGRLPMFVRSLEGASFYGRQFNYNCAYANTLLRKFPDLEDCIVQVTDGGNDAGA